MSRTDKWGQSNSGGQISQRGGLRRKDGLCKKTRGLDFKWEVLTEKEVLTHKGGLCKETTGRGRDKKEGCDPRKRS